MQMNYPKQVDTLLALPDVKGLFILSDDGELRLNRLPDPFVDEIFDELGQRLTSFIDAIGSSYNPTEEMLFGFAGYSLYVRLGKNFILGILSQEHPNVMGLRVGANLLIKQIKPEMLASMSSLPKPPADSGPGSGEASSNESSSRERGNDIWDEDDPREKKKKQKSKKKSSFNDIWG